MKREYSVRKRWCRKREFRTRRVCTIVRPAEGREGHLRHHTSSQHVFVVRHRGTDEVLQLISPNLIFGANGARREDRKPLSTLTPVSMRSARSVRTVVGAVGAQGFAVQRFQQRHCAIKVTSSQLRRFSTATVRYTWSDMARYVCTDALCYGPCSFAL